MPVKWMMAALLIVATAPSRALSSDTFTDDFTAGIDTLYWSVYSNQPLYSVDDSNGDVRLSKPVGGAFTFQAVRLELLCTVSGDFDASVDFSDAMIDRVSGTPGNQVQVNVGFGGQYFAVVRSDESPGGDNYHVFANPPSQWFGAQATTATQGTLRVTRVGTVVTGYFNGTSVYSHAYNAEPVTYLSFSLQNNGTTDATSVTFDHFTLTADTIACPLVTDVAERPARPSLTVTAYPNPFNPATTIAFSLPAAGTASLRVYDVTGRLVRTLVDGRESAGPHEVRWDGRDNGGLPVASGVYLVRLRAGTDAAIRKIVMLK